MNKKHLCVVALLTLAMTGCSPEGDESPRSPTAAPSHASPSSMGTPASGFVHQVMELNKNGTKVRATCMYDSNCDFQRITVTESADIVRFQCDVIDHPMTEGQGAIEAFDSVDLTLSAPVGKRKLIGGPHPDLVYFVPFEGAQSATTG